MTPPPTSTQKLRVIITGATGMVGEGVLHVALQHPSVESVLVVGRRTCGVRHEKLEELVVRDLFDLSQIEQQLRGYNACFFCLGTTSLGKSEEEYRRTTYELTMHFARTLVRLNDGLSFCYVSGMGTDGTERGRLMWARVKGKTENDLLALPFAGAYMFRPGYIRPIKGMQNTLAFSKPIAPFYPFLKRLYPNGMVTLEDIGRAMINAALRGYRSSHLECRDIDECARE